MSPENYPELDVRWVSWDEFFQSPIVIYQLGPNRRIIGHNAGSQESPNICWAPAIRLVPRYSWDIGEVFQKEGAALRWLHSNHELPSK